MCCSDEWRGWVSNNSPNSESCSSTSPFHPLELTGNFLVTVLESWDGRTGVAKGEIGRSLSQFLQGGQTMPTAILLVSQIVSPSAIHTDIDFF